MPEIVCEAAQPFAVVGVGVFDLGDRFFFGPFDGGEVAGLVVTVGGRPSFFGSRFRALAEFVVGVRRAGAFFELVAFVVGVCARPLLGGVVGRVVFVFGAAVFGETVVFVVRVFGDFCAGQTFGGGLFDLAVAVAGVDERRKHFRAFVHLYFAHLVRVVVGVRVFVFGFARERYRLQVRVFVVREFGRVRQPVGDFFEAPVFIEGARHGFFVGVGDLGLVVCEIVFVFDDFFVTVFAFGQAIELVVGVFRRSGAVGHLCAVAVFVVFVFDRRGFAAGVADFGEPVRRIVGVGRRASLGSVSLTRLPGGVVFLERFRPERIDDFGDLLDGVALVFGRVFVAVDLLDDLTGAVVFGFRDRFVGCFDLGRLVIAVVGVFRFVFVAVGHRFDVAVAIVFVFRDVAERIGDRERPALRVAFDFGREFRRFAFFDVPARADRRRLL